MGFGPRLRLASLMLGAWPIAVAQADGNGWYVGGDVGALFRESTTRNAEFSNNLGSGPGTETATFSPGFAIEGNVGYRISDRFRLEGQLGYDHYEADTVNPASNATRTVLVPGGDGGIPAPTTVKLFPLLDGRTLSNPSGGDRNGATFVLGGCYDIPISPDVVPYIGGGVGVYHNVSETAVYSHGAGLPTFTVRGSHATNALLQAEAGVSVAVADDVALLATYKFRDELESAQPNLHLHILEVGFRYAL